MQTAVAKRVSFGTFLLVDLITETVMRFLYLVRAGDGRGLTRQKKETK